MQSRWISWVVVGFLFPTSLVQAQTLPAQQNALRGLDGLRVEVTLGARGRRGCRCDRDSPQGRRGGAIAAGRSWCVSDSPAMTP